jgi:hypothetical protein
MDLRWHGNRGNVARSAYVVSSDMTAYADVADSDVAAHADVADGVDLEDWRGGLINFTSHALCAAILFCWVSFVFCDFSVAVAGGGT